jgi:hypothetical protein
LIGVAALSIVVRLTNLLPSQVTALGVTLSVADQRWFVRFLWIALLYLTLAFMLYAILDFLELARQPGTSALYGNCEGNKRPARIVRIL